MIDQSDRLRPLLLLNFGSRTDPRLKDPATHASARTQMDLINRAARTRRLALLSPPRVIEVFPWTAATTSVKRDLAAAAREAHAERADLIMDDAFRWFRKCKPADADVVLELIRELPARLFSVVDGAFVDEIPRGAALVRSRAGIILHRERSAQVKSGRAKAGAPRAPSPDAVLAARTRNRALADRRAQRLASQIERARQKLPEDKRENCGAIARVLEEEGVPTPRGGKWSARSVKRIIARVERIERGASG